MTAASEQETAREGFRDFAQRHIQPYAAAIDGSERFPEDLTRAIAARGLLTPWLSKEYGGQGMDFLSYGFLNEEFGHACSSTRSLLTCHGMVAQALARCGNQRQRSEFLPQLSSGDRIAAFAMTEPEVGSDAAHPQTEAIPSNEGYLLTGRKSWITFGRRADLFLVLARLEDRPTAFLVPRESPGLEITAINAMLGTRGSMLADLKFDGCAIPRNNLLGPPGGGFNLVSSVALHHGRYSVAWGCVGLLRACLEASVDYTAKRRQFGTEIRNHQLVAQKITDMLTSLQCAELLCRRAAEFWANQDPNAIMQTLLAKYYSSTAVFQAASDAVQLHGANGASDRYPVARYLRDAKVMELIEGSTQIQQIMIAKYAYRNPLSH